MPNGPTTKNKLNKMVEGLEKAKQAAEIGKYVPGVGGRAQDVEDAITVAEEGIGLFGKLKGLFRRKK